MKFANKIEIRKHILAKRAALGALERDEAAAKAASMALELLKDAKAVIALYRAMRGEISPAPLAEKLQALGKQLCLPVVTEQNELRFRAWHPGAPVAKGRLGVEEPLAEAPLVTPQILIVPLVGFDKSGHRLGTGGGFYDRALRALRRKDKNLRAFGYAFASQEVDTLPLEPHDESLDVVVTENGVFLPRSE